MNYFTSQRLDAEALDAELRKISGRVSGIFRLSDAEDPVFLRDEPLPEFAQKQVPFLFEAAFFDGRISISIRQYNDFWLFNRVEWNEAPPRKTESGDDYIVYRQFTKSREKLLFYTKYLPAEKNGFQVLTPAWNAFIGFAEED